MKQLCLIAAPLCAMALAAAGCSQPPKPESQDRTVPVVVAPVQPTEVVDQMTIRATVEPWESVRLSAEVPGKLVFIGKAEGDRVNRGERLFGIDKATYQAQVTQAEAQLAMARAQQSQATAQLAQAQATASYEEAALRRNKRLLERGAISQDEMDRVQADRDVAVAALEAAQAGVQAAESGLASAQAALEAAKVELEKTDIYAPLDGTFDAKLAELGEYVGPGSPLGDVVHTERLKAIVPVPEKDVVFVRPGETMEVRFDALGGELREGEVIFVKQVADPRTLTFPVHLAVDNADGRVRPGMIARVRLVRRKFEDAIAVPLFSVIRRADGYHVFVEQDGQAVQRDIELGVYDFSKVQVTEGLEPGDRLIIRGQRNLVAGDEVKVFMEGSPEATGVGPGLKPQVAENGGPPPSVEGAEGVTE